MVVRYPKRDSYPAVSVWKLVTQSYLRFPRALVTIGIAFGWSVVVGMIVAHKPPNKFEMIVNEAAERAKEIVKQDPKASSQGSLAADRLHHGN